MVRIPTNGRYTDLSISPVCVHVHVMIMGGLYQCIQPIGSHGQWHLGHHDQKHSANGGVLTKSLDLKVAHKGCRQKGL